MKEKQQKKKIVRIIACSGLVLILIILLAAGIFIKDLLSDVKRLDNNDLRYPPRKLKIF